MYKKYFLSIAFCGMLALSTAAPATAQEANVGVATTACTHNHECENCDEPVCLAETPVEAVDQAVAEESGSEVGLGSREEIKAKKAQNAKENDPAGGVITIVAMSIVLAALIILSILFLLFGQISSYLMSSRKRSAQGSKEEVTVAPKDYVDSGDAIAAIGMALSEHFGQRHDMEDTILTIKDIKKSYSPWNSKIYNMRHATEVDPGRQSIRRPLK